MNQDEKNSRPSPYLNIREAAVYCNLAVSTLYKRRRDLAKVPGAGRKLLFTRETLDQFMNRKPAKNGQRAARKK